MAMPDEDEDEFTELVSYQGNRADLVSAGANGVPRFLITKQGAPAGLLDPDYVRGLIAKTSGEVPVPDETALPNGIVLKGSPAAMAAFIHAASTRADGDAVLKAKYSAGDKRKMLAAGHAIKNENGDPAYPIGDADDLGNAIHAVGRGGPDHDHIRAYVIRRAKALGKSSMIPDNWNADGSLKSGVSKEAGVPDQISKDAGGMLEAALDQGQDGLDPTAPLAAPDDLDDVPGDPADPGSPAWEAVDAATASKWATILAWAKNAIEMLMDREMVEAATVDPDDGDNACDLSTACDAIDYAISVLAPFAVGEQSEADTGAADFEAIGKAAAGAEQPAQLITGLVSVAKAGRVLSSANEAKIRSAAQALTDVLASLPQAPDAAGPSAAVAKEGAMPQTEPAPVAKDSAPSPGQQAAGTGPVSAGGTTGLGQPREAGPADALPADGPQASLPGDVTDRTVVKSALPVVVFDHAGHLAGIADASAIVQKADGDKQMMAVFDQSGNLVGVVDASKIQPVSGAGKKDDAAPGDKPAADTSPDDAPAPDAAPAPDGDGTQPGPAAAAAPDPDDLQPQPSADAGTPADDVAKSGGTKTDATASTQDVVKAITEQVAQALERSQAAHAEVVAKMAADNAGLAETVEALKARLETVENTPAMPRVALNGAVPPAQLRGQDQGAPQVDVAKAAELRTALYKGSGPEQAQAFNEMQGMAVTRLQQIRASGPRQSSPAAS